MIAKRIKYLVTIWLLLATTIVVLERRSLDMLLENETDDLQRVASQRADQHDAHLTNLSALEIRSVTTCSEFL